MLFIALPPTIPHISDLADVVNRSDFSKINALIIDGSRGLGQSTTKLITCVGGKVTITYNLGENDALDTRREISGYGSSCDIQQLTISNLFELPLGNFNQVYYFPTPKIKIEDSISPDIKLIELYRLVYVDGFKSLLNQVMERKISASVFYPSTTFISNPTKKIGLCKC